MDALRKLFITDSLQYFENLVYIAMSLIEKVAAQMRKLCIPLFYEKVCEG